MNVSSKASPGGSAKRGQCQRGNVLVNTARAHCNAALDSFGVRLSSREIATRVGYAATLSAEMTSRLLIEHWTPEGLQQITSPDTEGRPLPAFAYKAMERLDWRAKSPAGVHTD